MKISPCLRQAGYPLFAKDGKRGRTLPKRGKERGNITKVREKTARNDLFDYAKILYFLVRCRYLIRWG
jgi:hypothetical protein